MHGEWNLDKRKQQIPLYLRLQTEIKRVGYKLGRALNEQIALARGYYKRIVLRGGNGRNSDGDNICAERLAAELFSAVANA